jgi:glycerate-2-kinase
LAAVDAERVTAHALEAYAPALDRGRGLRAIAAGKAAAGMARALEAALGSRLIEGLLTAESGPDRWRAVPGSHPRPSAASEAAGRASLAIADRARAEDGVLIVGLSGGASSMLAVPAPGLTIDDKAAVTGVLLGAGLDIGDINVVRRHLSAIKGGQLAARAGRSLTLAISDVCTPVEDDPSAIGSGPTAGDERTFEDALAILRRHGVEHAVPAGVRQHLEAGAAGRAAGPVRPADVRLREASYRVIASRRDAMRAAATAASGLGYEVHVRPEPVVGEARAAAREVLAAAAAWATRRPVCLISSGETVVFLRGRGRGGRNQELAVAALEPLSALAPAALASIGTDGRDGPTDAAGAIVDAAMWARLGGEARARRAAALEANDSYPFLDGLGALLRTGATGTNVGDLQVLLLGESGR